MTSFVGGLLVKGWGLITHGLSGHLEPGSGDALVTRGLLWTQEGLQPAWASGLALPGALVAQPSLPLTCPGPSLCLR